MTTMKMVAFLFLILCLPCLAQTRTVIVPVGVTTDVIVPAGKVVEILTFAGDSNGSLLADGVLFSEGTSYAPQGGPERREIFLAGPLTLSIKNFSGARSQVCTYRMTENQETQAAAAPSNSVVIPSDAAGPVEIVLESSVDMITWTVANPGTYGASTEKRFFRVRAVSR